MLCVYALYVCVCVGGIKVLKIILLLLFMYVSNSVHHGHADLQLKKAPLEQGYSWMRAACGCWEMNMGQSSQC